MKTVTIQLEALTCPSCIQKIEGAMKKIDGVDRDTVKVMFNASRVKANFESDKTTLEEIEKTITRMGYTVEKSKVKAA
ncbi:MAG TPA: heavy-metal-associated domain-containing protein [Bacteroidales bacterium]|nr:heavy-metal-associated domain-containing protein [Bacteroidales bacterium]